MSGQFVQRERMNVYSPSGGIPFGQAVCRLLCNACGSLQKKAVFHPGSAALACPSCGSRDTTREML